MLALVDFLYFFSTYYYYYKWVRSLRSLHPLGSLRLLRVWLTLASLAHSHGRDELASFSYSECGLRSLRSLTHMGVMR